MLSNIIYQNHSNLLIPFRHQKTGPGSAPASPHRLGVEMLLELGGGLAELRPRARDAEENWGTLGDDDEQRLMKLGIPILEKNRYLNLGEFMIKYNLCQYEFNKLGSA